MHSFEGKTADEVWLQAARALRDPGLPLQPSRAGPTREILGAIFTILEPIQRWTFSRQPAVNPAFALAEVIWILSGSNDSSFINYWNPKLPLFAGRGACYHGAYGFRLKHKHKINQLEQAYHVLRNRPESRQVVLQIWDAAEDLPRKTGRPRSADIPCNVCALVTVRDGKLHWTQIVRSNDLFLGVPHNFVQFTCLHEILASWLGIPLGPYRQFANCLHVYERDKAQLQKVTPIESPRNTDRAEFTKEEYSRLFLVLAERAWRMTAPSLSRNDLHRLATGRLPEIFFNWLRVLAADSARRRKWEDVSNDVMNDCTNPALRHLWSHWASRMKLRAPSPSGG